MFKSLGVNAIGVRADLARAADLAQRYGFHGLHINMNEVAQLGVERTRDILARAGVRPAAFWCPMSYKAQQPEFDLALARLPQQCEAAVAVGMDRTSTFIAPWHDEMTFAENYAFHLERLTQMAIVFKNHGIRFGLEFLGPKTLRDGKKNSFIHTMDGMLKLCREIGTGNVGLLLDAWHLYASGGAMTDIGRLTDADVVEVHINDAPAGVPMDQLQDLDRRLPGETGVIDAVAFLRHLAGIGYTGPVLVEPFSQRVNALPPAEAVRVTAEALDAVWKKAGL